MEVILVKDVENVGLRGEVVNVARGYARNYLLPRRLAELATDARVAELKRRDAERARHEARTFEQGQQIAELLGKTVLRFEVKAGPTGALFGSVTSTDIADELWRARKVRVDRRKIDLEESIKRVGRYEVPVEVFTDLTVEVKTLVVPEGGELPPEEPVAATPEDPVTETAPETSDERDAEPGEETPSSDTVQDLAPPTAETDEEPR